MQTKRRNEWLPPLPPPPHEFAELVQRARLNGFWLWHARDESVRQECGGLYRVTRPEGLMPLYVSDDLENIRGWLACN